MAEAGVGGEALAGLGGPRAGCLGVTQDAERTHDRPMSVRRRAGGRGDEPGAAQMLQVLRGVGLLEIEFRHQRAGGQLTVTEGVDDCDPGGISERLEYLGFEFPKCLVQYSNISIFDV